MAQRVLVVDDYPPAANVLARLLRLSGCEVRTAENGSDALRAADEFRPNVVVLDLDIPKPDGYEVADKIRQEPWGKSMLLIGVSGWAEEKDRERGIAAGLDTVLTKPVLQAELTQLIGDCSMDKEPTQH